MSQLSLDCFESLTINASDHPNEVRTLQMLQHGLRSLANGIKRREMRYSELAKTMNFFQFGAASDAEMEDLCLISCIFHWFGVSACNYARLIGFIRGLEKKLFTRDDLKSPLEYEKIKKAIGAYVKNIPELASVIVWRKKVASHFAITDPRMDDNIATLNMSVMFQVTLQTGIYRAGGMRLTQSAASGTHVSSIPTWSVSEVFESLIPRFWPNLRLVTEKNESA